MITRRQPGRRQHPVAVADVRPRAQPERGRRLSPNEVPRTGLPPPVRTQNSRPPPSRRLFFLLRARPNAPNVYFKSHQDVSDTGSRWSGRAIGAAQANFLSAQHSFREGIASRPAESSALIIAILLHHFSFTGAPRFRDWEMTHCIHTSCASPGHNVPRRRKSRRNTTSRN